MRGLTHQQLSLQEFRTQLGNQLHAHNRSIYRVELVERQLQASLTSIDGQLKELESASSQHLKGDPDIWWKGQQLQIIIGGLNECSCAKKTAYDSVQFLEE